MRVYLSCDIEGISGLVSWAQCGRPNSEHFDYRWARERFTQDVNAAIVGAFEGGATYVLVKDSHGNSKNLLIDQLDSRAELVSGHGGSIFGMMAGIDSTFDAACLIGYHAKAGAWNGVMDHTISGRVHRLWVNETEMGEIGISALDAGLLGVPIVAVTSDAAGCSEAKGHIHNLITYEVKQAMGRYMAHSIHPENTAPQIQSAVKRGVQAAAGINPFTLEKPFRVKIEFNRTEEASMCERIPGVTRVDGYSLTFTSDEWNQAHRAIWTMIAMAEAGYQSNS